MRSRIALSIAPILLITLGQQAAQAAISPEKHSGHTTHSRMTAAAHRHVRSRYALASLRYGRHVKFRHLALRHVDPRQVAVTLAVTETDGWNPAVADISYPTKPLGASVHLVSYTEAADASTPSASGIDTSASLVDAAPIQAGIASYYGGRHNGRRTSSGRIFDEHAMTAAHATLPFGTKVLVRVAGTDRSVVVTITDRLYSRHRIIDLSEGAAERLGMMRQGLAMVTLTPQD